MNSTDSFLVGHQEAADAIPEVPEKKDGRGNIIQHFKPAQPAKEYKEGVKVTLKTPIPFPVLLKALEFFRFQPDGSIDLHATATAGEVIVKSQVVQDENWKKVEIDGRLMLSLCIVVASVYLVPEETENIKKNSPQASTSSDKDE